MSEDKRVWRVRGREAGPEGRRMHVFVEAESRIGAIIAAKMKEPGLDEIVDVGPFSPPAGVKVAGDDPTRDAALSRIIEDQRAMIETLTAKVEKYEAVLGAIANDGGLLTSGLVEAAESRARMTKRAREALDAAVLNAYLKGRYGMDGP